MAFDSGTFINPNDGLDKIRLFLIAQGWAQESWTTESGNQRLHMSKGGVYLNAKASNAGANIWQACAFPTTSIGFSLGTAFNAANAWYDQTGVVRNISNQGIGACLPLPAGAVTSYELFYDPAYESLVIYVQATTGVWRWAGFGAELVKAGAWTGGPWVASCADFNYANFNPNGAPGHGSTFAQVYPFGANRDNYSAAGPLIYLRADVDTFTGKWLSCGPNDITGKAGGTNIAGGVACSSNVPALTGLLERSCNAMNSLSVLLPVQVFAVRDAGGKSLLGSLPNIYASNVSGLAVGAPYVLGASSYYPFPADASSRGTVIKRV